MEVNFGGGEEIQNRKWGREPEGFPERVQCDGGCAAPVYCDVFGGSDEGQEL